MRLSSTKSLLLILFCMTILNQLFGQNYALQFDGVDDYVQGTTTGFPTGNNDRTIELWFYKISQPVEEGTLFGYGSWGQYENLYEIFTIFDNPDTRLAFSQWGSGFESNSLILPDQWYHVAVVSVEDNVRLYLNGHYESADRVYFDTPPGTGFYIGKAPLGYDNIRRFNGIIDEVRIWNRALSQQEIQLNRYKSLSGSEGGLVGYWPFNEGDGNIANDLSGNTNNGTISGAIWTDKAAPTGSLVIFCEPGYAYRNHNIFISIQGVNTHFSDNGGTSNVWISKNDNKIDANNFQVISDDSIDAEFFIPAYTATGFWDINVQKGLDSVIVKRNALELVEKGNYALQFDEPGEFIEIPDNASLRIKQKITLESWINFKSDGGGQPIILSKGSYGDDYEFLLTDNAEESQLRISIAPDRLNSNRTLSAGNWYHVATTYDGSIIKIYINGELDASLHASGDLNVSSFDLCIGQRNLDSWPQYNGLMDELRIWNVARSQNDIQSNMYNHLNGSEEGLVGYWSANEGGGNTLHDLSSNHNNGTFYGAQWAVSRAPIGKTITLCLPDYSFQSHNLSITLQGANTHFLAGTAGIKNIWLSQEENTISAYTYNIESNTTLDAKFYIPQNTLLGEWNINVESDTDSLITMLAGIEVLPPPAVKLQESNTSSWLQSLYAIDDQVCWLAGNNGVIQKTVDGGNNWQSQNSGTSNVLYAIFFSDQMSGWTAGQYGTILKTTDGGESWDTQNSGTTNNLQSVCFVNSQTGWVVGRLGTILKTTDGGQTWQPQSSGTTSWLYSVCFTDANNGWIVGSKGTILYTTDGGSNWTPQTSATTNYFSFVYFNNTNQGFAVGSNGTILKTSDGGQNWISKNSGTTEWLKSCAFIDGQTGFVVGENGLLLMTSDAGESWTTRRSFTTKALNALYFANSNSGWIAGETGTVLYLSLSEHPASLEDDPDISYGPQVFQLYQNYPNPFNSITNIEYTIRAQQVKPQHVNLSIYNIIGQKVATLVDKEQPAGSYKVEWDAQGFASGVYLFKLETGNGYRKSRKLLLLK